MAQKTYDVKKQGSTLISKKDPKYAVREIGSKDGYRYAKYDTHLTVLERRVCKVLAKWGLAQRAMYISRCYSTASHNKKIGGSKSSYHLKGKAMDRRYVRLKNGKLVTIPTSYVMCAGQIADAYGLEQISSEYAHMDTRSKPNKWYAVKKGSSYPTHKDNFTKYKIKRLRLIVTAKVAHRPTAGGKWSKYIPKGAKCYVYGCKQVDGQWYWYVKYNNRWGWIIDTKTKKTA